jgi:hypothetical protein
MSATSHAGFSPETSWSPVAPTSKEEALKSEDMEITASGYFDLQVSQANPGGFE